MDKNGHLDCDLYRACHTWMNLDTFCKIEEVKVVTQDRRFNQDAYFERNQHELRGIIRG